MTGSTSSPASNDAASNTANGAAEHAAKPSSRVPKTRSMEQLPSDASTTPRAPGLPKRIASISSQLDWFVKGHGGTRAIHSVLVANNGIAAVKFIRSIRMWAFHQLGHERAVTLVAMATPEDMRIDAEHIRMADQFVEVPGGSNINNYANVRLIVATAQRTKVDAVWPGWGHASEKPELPSGLAAAGVVFLGPPSRAMAALGDKIGSTILAQSAGVPTIPWSGSGVVWRPQPPAVAGDIPTEVYGRACVHSLDDALECCRRIGYPVMLKASWGGGGKGIRKVHQDEEVRAVFRQIQGEVPGSPIFAMKLAPQSRHLEVQLLCDMHGNVVSLFTRDCSTQRRHQKIVEEGPAVVAPPDVLAHMETCARALARSVGYVGAATVEYLYHLDSQTYCFLELNPRLQVEHPVTEWISGVNIPAAQLLIGMGVPLYNIPDIRALYGANPDAVGPVDLGDAARKAPQGHVVAVRITAENAVDGFKPTAGSIDEISFRSTPEVWGYFSVKGGGGIHEFSDSQFGHLFSKGRTREAAIRAMVVALKEIKIRGEIHHICDYVTELLQDEEFLGDGIHTGWLDSRIAAQVHSSAAPTHLVIIAGMLLRSTLLVNSRTAEYVGYLAKGQLPPARISLTRFEEEMVLEGIKYKVAATRTGPLSYRLFMGDSVVDAVVRRLNDGGLLMQVDGQTHVVHFEEEALGTRLSIDSATALLTNDTDPSRLLAASPGKLLRFLVADGSRVAANAPYAEVEVMKMVMPLLTPVAGVLTFAVAEGAVLAAGDLIARLEVEDGAAVRSAVPYSGGFPELGPPLVVEGGVEQACKRALELVDAVMDGYEHDGAAVATALMEVVNQPSLPWAQVQDLWAVLQPKLPQAVVASVEAVLAVPGQGAFPAAALLDIMQQALQAADTRERPALAALLDPAQRLVMDHLHGPKGFCRRVVLGILERFLTVEQRFSRGDATDQEIVDSLRLEHSDRLQTVLDMVVSHQGLAAKCELLLGLMTAAVLQQPDAYRPLLRRIAALRGAGYADVVQRAQQLLEVSLLGELSKVVASLLGDGAVLPDAREAALLAAARDLHEASGGGASSDNERRRAALASCESISAELGSVTAPATPHEESPTARGALVEEQRRETLQEGLFAGLGSLMESSVLGSNALDARMGMLVEVPAAVEDALALLLLQSDPVLRERALATYVRRVYFPLLLQQPTVEHLQQGGMCAAWAHMDAATDCTMVAREAVSAAVVVPSLAALPAALPAAIRALQRTGPGATAGTLHVLLNGTEESLCNVDAAAKPLLRHAPCTPASALSSALTSVHRDTLAAAAAAATTACGDVLCDAGISLVTVAAITPVGPVRAGVELRDGIFTPHPLLTHVEAPSAQLLELNKLAGLPVEYAAARNRQWHAFVTAERPRLGSPTLLRVFVRCAVRQLGRPAMLAASAHGDVSTGMAGLFEELGDALAAALEHLQRTSLSLGNGGRALPHKPDWAHVFFSVLPAVEALRTKDPPKVAAALRAAAARVLCRQAAALRTAAVAEWEIRLRVRDGSGAWRVRATMPTGHEVGEEHVVVLRESWQDGQRVCVPALPPSDAPPVPVMQRYGQLQTLQQKRLAARRHKTSYCYDFPAVFATALRGMWEAHAVATGAVQPSGPLVHVEELVPEGPLSISPPPRLSRTPLTTKGTNTVGVVAWVLTLHTPESPGGRQVVAIANDITHHSGAFGTAEDAMFLAATHYALQERLPVVYLAANSGARVGLAQEVKQCIQVAWTDDADPARGVDYLYLTEADRRALGGEAVRTVPVTMTDGEVRHRLCDVIGAEEGLGVECLSGSGAIAAAYSRAFHEGLTMTLVTGRTVGIGAYLARLGRRCVQRADQPIILTGYAALNKLLGRQVYSSHMQLGGPRVMGHNGVSHHIVADDLQGVTCILQWLSFMPPLVGAQPLNLPPTDPPARAVAYTAAPGEKLEARAAIAGASLRGDAPQQSSPPTAHREEGWVGGLFDHGSWVECQAGWARTVITGRARLGGVPVGVIAVETQTVMLHCPADPGMPDSAERVVPQAGQVWFPDSALKTAHAMEEFSLERLPLFVLANWRGFSGGQRDLFEGVLQAGSMIVEQLRRYSQPVFVYMMPGAELRGGAWVVVDSQINQHMVEMYADPSARGGVLEPEGIVEIKFRAQDLLATMHRIDSVLQSLKEQGAPPLVLQQREKALLPAYTQVATAFAELHDTPTRMLAKGVLRGIVPWATARSFFHTRLRRRMAQESLVQHVQAADTAVSREEAVALLQMWFLTSPPAPAPTAIATRGVVLSQVAAGGPEAAWSDDAAFLGWADGATGTARVAVELKALRSKAAARALEGALQTVEGKEGLLQGLAGAMQRDAALRLQLRALLTQLQ